MKSSRFYLIFSAAVLLPISMSYGVNLNRMLPQLFQMHSAEGETVHVLRAIMGLYLSSIILWFLGAIRGGQMMRAALISEIVFMSGLTAGRLLDLLLDGWPRPMLIVYTVAELALAGWGLFCLKRFDAMQRLTTVSP
jgi:hypothetical protein